MPYTSQNTWQSDGTNQGSHPSMLGSRRTEKPRSHRACRRSVRRGSSLNEFEAAAASEDN